MHRAICLLFCIIPIWAQTTSNPDFSVIGQFQVIATDTSVSLNGADLELAITGNLNPYARAEVYLHKHDVSSALELEEAVLTIERGLPFGTAARIGRLRPSLGLMNREHSHLWPFIEAPTAIINITGEEMWTSTGAELSWLLALPWATELSIGTFAGRISAEDHGHDETVADHVEGVQSEDLVFSGRLGHFFDLNSITHFGIGSSFYWDPEEANKILNLDSKLRWRPDSYRGLTIQGELFMNLNEQDTTMSIGDENHEEELEYATYAYLNYQFNRRWNIGVMLDGVKHAEETSSWSPGLFFGFSPVEESSVLRVVIKNASHEGNNDILMLTQLIWSLGPHKPHSF